MENNKYARLIEGIDGESEMVADVYSILDAYGVSHAIGHAIKKLLMAGERGHKDYQTDLREAIQSIKRELGE